MPLCISLLDLFCPVTNPRLQTYTKGLTGWHVQLVTIYILVITCNTDTVLACYGRLFHFLSHKSNQVLNYYYFVFLLLIK